MAVITKDLYEGCLLGAGQLRPWKSTMVHIFPLHTSRPLCGTFASGLVFSADDSVAANPRCKLCRKFARTHYDGVE